ncbi:alpha/beta hydrolase [Paraburkholderia sp. BL10I2N1]|uniref:alpha/beta hydrolase n=1 Tax=Paraburkholderia sp. BL10I2N1 TaxID=1938796 RepID=UPI00105E0614|nr:alpha/beta hydrolase [Paraburkholderia sp. BL10I2N1]TDN61358.1 acetyl esterase/lipase [Paraburkholderia sp. BL10I2N1]
MLEPEIAAFVARAEAIYPDNSASLPTVEGRAIYERFAAAFTAARPAGVGVQNATLVTATGHSIRLRLYAKGEGAQSPGALLYFHGGGFVFGSLDSHEIVTARLAADTGLCVVAVDYRLAPEHPAPAAHEDCLDVTLAALDGRLPFRSLPAPLLLAGDSAGANLAASVAMRLRDSGIEGVAGVALIYPMLGAEPQSPARETEANAPMLTLAGVRLYSRLYWGDAAPPVWTVPIEASRFDGLPPVLSIGVEHDPLRDDAHVFAERIQAAGGEVQLWIAPGLVHGCWRALETSPGVQRMHDKVCRFLLDSACRRAR